MSMYHLIAVALYDDRHGWVVAALEPASDYCSPQRLVVGDVGRVSGDGQRDAWKAWLWPEAGGALHVSRSCAAVEAPSPEGLARALRRRAEKEGTWWD